ncbi:MAG: hypothetical protein AB7O26_12910 [Planctomycetaceae bacterium]
MRRRPKWTRLLGERSFGVPFQPRWYHSVAYALVQAPTFLWMSLVLSILTALCVTAWVSIDPLANNTIAYQVFGFSLFFLSYVLATTMTYFNSVLALAARGKAKVEPRIVASAGHAGANCGVWIACFLTGPVVVFGAAIAYWMYCGELDFIDWTILAELAFAGLAWWLFALLHTNASETYRVPFPNEVLRLAFAMRKAMLELVVPASLVFAGHILLAAYSLGRLQDQPVLAALLLSLFWGSGLYCTSFTLRQLGLAYCRMQRETRASLTA